MTKKLVGRLCAKCGKRPPAGQGRAKYCQLCRQADPHRHCDRVVPHILVGVDCESALFTTPTGATQEPVTFSYGRSDGTSGSLKAPEGDFLTPLQVFTWMRDELSDRYIGADGISYRQALYGFHFGHDAVLLLRRYFPDSKLQLVHKATARKRGLLCATEHAKGEECPKYHRYDQTICQDTLVDGGEDDYIAYDAEINYAFATTPGRRFYMEYRPHGDRFEENQRIDIHDVGNLFPGTFEQVIDLWDLEYRDGDREIIKWGKAHRGENFINTDRNKVAHYSEAECVSLARLLEKFLKTVHEVTGITIPPSSLYGSGSVAGAVLKYHRVPKRKDLEECDRKIHGTQIDDIAQLSYFGGKIEAPVIGILTQPAYPRDICSAYPSQCIDLPCMKRGHGEWRDRPGHYRLPKRTVGYVLASWSFGRVRTSTPPFMVRNKKASVFQPQNGNEIWVTLPEYQAAIAHWGSENITAIHTVWWGNTCECPPPLAFLKDIYKRRLQEKARASDEKLSPEERRQAKGHEEILKLIICSVYGKLCQRNPVYGAYTNLHWGAMITGGTRAKVNIETWTGEALGGIVVYQHTDSVTFVNLRRESEGSKLGDWGADPVREGMLVMQSGITISLDGGKSATRGVSKKVLVPYAETWAQERREMFKDHPTTWEVMQPMDTRMVTLRQVRHAKDPTLGGQFITSPREVGFFSRKREFDNARPLGKKNPYAWRVPPKALVFPEDVAQLEDLESYQTLIRQRAREGLWDDSGI